MDDIFACVDAGDSPDRLEHLLQLRHTDINEYWKDGYSLLLVAASRGHTNTTERLIKLGANVDAATKTGKTALMEAARKAHCEVVKMLLSYGANPDLTDKDGWRAVNFATPIKSMPVDTLLLFQPSRIKALKEERAEKNAMEQIRKNNDSFVEAQKKTAADASTAILKALTDPSPVVTDATDATGHTWLHPFLAGTGLSADEISLCEKILVRKQSIRSMKLFARISFDALTHAYLKKIGIEALGVQQIVLDLHEQCVVAARSLDPTLNTRARDKVDTKSHRAARKAEQKRIQFVFEVVCVCVLFVFLTVVFYLMFHQNQAAINIWQQDLNSR